MDSVEGMYSSRSVPYGTVFYDSVCEIVKSAIVIDIVVTYLHVIFMVQILCLVISSIT